MNACVKTGATVHMIPHDLVFQADIYEVGGAIVVRANGMIVRGVNAFPRSSTFCANHPPTHELHDDHGRGFWREDLGIFVVPPDCFTSTSTGDTK